MALNCQVCDKQTSKYKCPRCRLQYCSVACYKCHQNQECQPPAPEPNVTIEIDRKGTILSQNVLFPTDDTVMPATLEKLRSSEELKTLLENPHLRTMMREVDTARNPEKAMQIAMMEPIFTELADVLLKTVEPEEKDEDY